MNPKQLELEIERALRDNDDQLAQRLLRLAKTGGSEPPARPALQSEPSGEQRRVSCGGVQAVRWIR
jgi:hypothetical protein